VIQSINGPVLIAHAENDWDIPDFHSDVLFDGFLDGVLPELTLPEKALRATREDYEAISASLKKRQWARQKIVHHVDMGGFGYIDTFWDKNKERNVTLVKSKYGGHDYLGVQEGVQDAMGRLFGLF
jgi:abhydrolase domain-containing protein 12